MTESVQKLMWGALIVLLAAGPTRAATRPSAVAVPALPRPLHTNAKFRAGTPAVPPALRRAIDSTLGQNWSQQAELTASDGSPGDEFGASVALSGDGNTALVGAPYVFYGSGAAYVFTKSDDSWTEIAEICCGFGGDAFGSAVALSADGNTGLISSPGYTTYPLEENGAVYVYTGGNWGGWTARLEADDEANFNYFGESVALSADGSTALIGADGRDSNAGAAYVFTGSGSNWSQQAELTASDGAGGDEFAYSLALSQDGTTALFGAPFRNSSAGAAYVFTDSGGTWSQNTELTASDGAAGDFFGGSVALSADGTIALLGAGGHDSYNGAAYVFAQSGGVWSQQTELADPGPGGDVFGGSVALSSDGATALLGAYDRNNGTGSAYVFAESGGTWTQQTELTASDGTADDFFGIAAALSGDATTALVGAYGRDSFTGAAYVFNQTMTEAGFRPSSGSSGSTTHLLGGDFTPGETVDLSIGGRSGTVQANANGRFDVALHVPNVPPHAYTLTATGETSGLTAHATFTVTASRPGTMPTGPANWIIGNH